MVHIHNGIVLGLRKDRIVQFVTTWMGLQSFIQIKLVRKRVTDIELSIKHVRYKDIKIQMA